MACVLSGIRRGKWRSRAAHLDMRQPSGGLTSKPAVGEPTTRKHNKNNSSCLVARANLNCARPASGNGRHLDASTSGSSAWRPL